MARARNGGGALSAWATADAAAVGLVAVCFHLSAKRGILPAGADVQMVGSSMQARDYQIDD